MHPNEVKESVQETLNGGVRYGYIQRSNRKYYAAPVDLDAVANGGAEVARAALDATEVASDAEEEDDEAKKAESGSELEDRTGRRRGRKRGSRSRSRSRRSRRRRH